MNSLMIKPAVDTASYLPVGRGVSVNLVLVLVLVLDSGLI